MLTYTGYDVCCWVGHSVGLILYVDVVLNVGSLVMENGKSKMTKYLLSVLLLFDSFQALTAPFRCSCCSSQYCYVECRLVELLKLPFVHN